MRFFFASAFVLVPLAAIWGSGCSSDAGPTAAAQGTPDASASDGATTRTTSTVDSGNTTSTDAGSDADAASAGPATGTVGGQSFTFAHGIATPKMVGENGTLSGYQIYLSNDDLDCTTLKVEGAATLDIELAGTPPPAQTYAVIESFETSADASQAEADFNAYNATCGTVTSESSLSGSVTITSFDASSVAGSFTIAFESSDRTAQGSIAGSFTAVVCPAFPALSCQPHDGP